MSSPDRPPRPADNTAAYRRRPVSRRRYAVRRLGALLLVGALGFAVVTAVSALVGGEGGAAPSGPDPSGGQDAGADADPGAEPSGAASALSPQATEAVAPTEAPPATAPAVTDPGAEDGEDQPPSPDHLAEVYIVGDSDAGTFGPYLQRLLDGTLIVDTELNYKVSSGLARPDFFDWPSELRRLLPEVDPDIVVVTFGGNDGQPLTEPDGTPITGLPESDTTDWSAEYQRRAGEVMDLLLEDDRTVIWVGIPNDDNPDVTARMSIQDQAAKAAAAERPEVIFIDTWTRFSGRDGGWAEFVIDPRDGQGKDVRASDGFHLNEVGAEILALDIAQAIRDDLRARGANI